MYTFLLIILFAVSLLLIVTVLVQSGKGGGLAASFGGAASSADAFVGVRQAATLFTRASWWLGGLFLALGLLLQLLSSRAATAPESVLDQPFSAPVAPAPTTAPGAPQTGLPLTPAPEAPAPTPQP